MRKHNSNIVQSSLIIFSLSALLSCSKKAIDSSTHLYTDGVYKARGEYGNLPSHIDVTVKLQSNIVTDVEVQPLATDPTSLDLQRRFAAAVPQEVEGKHLDQVNIGRLAGSSGTPVGFNDAIRQIKEQSLKK